MKTRGNIFRSLLPPVVVLILAVAAMEIAARMLNEPFLLPRPGAVALAMVDHRMDLAASLWTTTQATLIGFFASAVAGVAVAMILAAWPLARRAIYPYTVFFQTVPIVAIAPLLVIWCGPGIGAVALSSFIVSVFPVIANTMAGLLSTDPALEDLFRLYEASPWARLWKLKLPSAMPSIFTGLRIAAGLAVIGTVVGEFLVGLFGPGEGLGVRIISAKKTGHTEIVFAAVLLASLLGLAMFAAINLAAKLLLRRWHAPEQN
ncbi:MAG TPA: ABC transporter permease [Tepidisphaeraceae bacterium]|jgi:NitT/TauT family transport system permease protein|nr:ABC transporter permease [Tepidisphaeraceae bacterium]